MTVSPETVSVTQTTRHGTRAPPEPGAAECPDAKAANPEARQGFGAFDLPERMVDELANILADALVADLRALPKLL